MVKSATKHTKSISAMALAATSVSLLLPRSRLVTEVFPCKKSIEKTRLVAAANWAQNAWNQTQHKWANHVELEEFFEIFLMSCVVILVER